MIRTKLVISAFCLAATAGLGCSQKPMTRSATVQSAAAGTLFSGTLQNTLSSLHNSKGDRFTVRVDNDVRDDNGRILLRAGTVLQGRVVDVDAGRKSWFEDEKRAARLRVTFDGPPVGLVDVGGYAHAGIGENTSILIPSIGPRSNVGGGPRDESAGADKPAGSQVYIPEGTRVQLIFTR